MYADRYGVFNDCSRLVIDDLRREFERRWVLRMRMPHASIVVSSLVTIIFLSLWGVAEAGGLPGMGRPDVLTLGRLAEVFLGYAVVAFGVALCACVGARSGRRPAEGAWARTGLDAAARETARLRARQTALSRRSAERSAAVPLSVPRVASIVQRAELAQPSVRLALPPEQPVAEVPRTPSRTAHTGRSGAPAPRLRIAEPSPTVVRDIARPSPSWDFSATSLFHVEFLLDGNGRPIGSDSRAAWLEARCQAVTATDCKKIVRKSGVASKQRDKLLSDKLTGATLPRLAAFEHGIRREPVIAQWVWENFGIVHNQGICVGESTRHLATPDGVGDGVVAEIKTAVRSLREMTSTYSDQLQWQLHVTRSERVLFVVENNPRLSRESLWVERDEERISILVKHADLFLEELDERRLSRRA